MCIYVNINMHDMYLPVITYCDITGNECGRMCFREATLSSAVGLATCTAICWAESGKGTMMNILSVDRKGYPRHSNMSTEKSR